MSKHHSPEMQEGPAAFKRFKDAMKSILTVPKPAKAKKKAKRKKT